MKTKALLGLIACGLLGSAAQPILQAHAEPPQWRKPPSLQLATGQYLTPLALAGSTQDRNPDARSV